MSQQPSPYPFAYDTQKADEIRAIVCAAASENNIPTPDAPLFAAIFGNSPFLSENASRFPLFTARCLNCDPNELLEEILESLKQPRPEKEKTTNLMAFLRTQKAHISLLTATADVAKWWSLDQVTQALSQFADACLELGLAHLLYENMVRGELAWPKVKPKRVCPTLTKNCGYFVLGMGKLGAFELNYSSDIDLIALYDPSQIEYIGKKTAAVCFVKITQELMQLIEQRTMHGYVFRTDLRLRPDPSATPLALSVEAAENYYHSMAVNWERSAMIKARVVAGDKDTGAVYLDNMSRWVWRKNTDFAALNDIAAIKNQINRHYEQEAEYIPGFNVKLGHGGIREIEFFAQVNQLLHAGRHPELRIRQTLKTLSILADIGFITNETKQQLTEAYVFLRTLEHRLQMVDDAQTHTLPEAESDIQRVAMFMHYDNSDHLLQTIQNHCETVSGIYDQLMPDQEKATPSGYSDTDLPQTLKTLSFDTIESSFALIQGWRRGRYRALRTERARSLLEKCLPSLLQAFSKTHNPSAALARFDQFIAQLPAGVQLFSLLQSNPSLFRLLARVMGLAPALADTLSKKPQLWDMVLEPHFYAPVEDEIFLAEELNNLLTRAHDFQDVLDITRRYAAEQNFRTGVQVIEALASVEETGAALSRVADVILQALIPRVCEEFAAKHGTFPGGGIAVLAMGKYGGDELTHTSDLDIVFLYHTETMDSLSDGNKPLAPSQYFSRLGQHIITAITALTPEGRLYEVDTRLRPSGSQGPLVVTLKTFEDYYLSSAWTWEHMALTRARIILAPENMKDLLAHTVRKVLTLDRDSKNLLTAVAEMREKLFTEFGKNSVWAIKQCRGGLVDMEFICQYLMLREGKNVPELFSPNLVDAITQLGEHSFLEPKDAQHLLKSQAFQQKIQSILRLSVGPSPSSSDEISAGLQQILIDATKHQSFQELERELNICQQETYNIYKKLIEDPANLIK